jgi:serine/threonine protein kinase
VRDNLALSTNLPSLIRNIEDLDGRRKKYVPNTPPRLARTYNTLQSFVFARKVFDGTRFNYARAEWNMLLQFNQNSHDRFMRALGAFIHADSFSIIFLYAENTLEKLLMADFPDLRPEDIWKQILGISEALECLHEDNNIVHTDLKPQNVLIHNGTWKLADFGCSRLIVDMESMEGRDIQAGRVYSPPETILDRPACDIWSLGCILSEIATSDLQKRDGLKNYRNERKSEDAVYIKSECFHMNKKAKQSVSTRHNDLLDLVCKSKSGKGEKLSSWQERFYSKDLFGLVEQMLGPMEGRPSASEVSKNLRWFIEQASDADEEPTREPDIWRSIREMAIPGDSPKPYPIM